MADPLRLRRSTLSVPGSAPKMIAKAAASRADVGFVDLEDAVAPDRKPEARRNAVEGLRAHDWGRTARGVRVNGVDTRWCHADLIEVVAGAGDRLDVVIIPKVRTAREVWFVDDLLGQLESEHGLEPGRIGLEALIEEAEALQRVDEIARCSPRLEAVTLGMGDLAASLGMRGGHIGVRGAGADVWAPARHRLVVAARSAGIEPIDGPLADFRDPEALRDAASTFAAEGGGGKWCIHPDQIDVVNEVFSPTDAEIEQARQVVAAMRDAEARGEGAASVGGMMVDAASVRAFEQRLERARRCAAD